VIRPGLGGWNSGNNIFVACSVRPDLHPDFDIDHGLEAVRVPRMSLHVIALPFILQVRSIYGCGKTQTAAAWHPWPVLVVPVLVVLARSSHFDMAACCAINIRFAAIWPVPACVITCLA